jgi:hypothetical protein
VQIHFCALECLGSLLCISQLLDDTLSREVKVFLRTLRTILQILFVEVRRQVSSQHSATFFLSSLDPKGGVTSNLFSQFDIVTVESIVQH